MRRRKNTVLLFFNCYVPSANKDKSLDLHSLLCITTHIDTKHCGHAEQVPDVEILSVACQV